MRVSVAVWMAFALLVAVVVSLGTFSNAPPDEGELRYQRFEGFFKSTDDPSKWTADRTSAGISLHSPEGRFIRLEGDNNRIAFLKYGAYEDIILDNGKCLNSCESVSEKQWTALYQRIRKLVEVKIAALP